MKRLPISFFIVIFFFAFFYSTSTFARTCGETGCAEYGCTGGYVCNGGNDTCGSQYNQCTGATNTTCQANTGWDTTSPCNTANECTGSGTRTATWTPGTCSTNCGNSNTRTDTCTCSSNNTCPITCTGPVKACAATNVVACACVNGAPQAPAITSVTPTCTTNGSTTINWTFGSTTGCGNAWGYACSAGSNTFYIMDGAATIASGIPAGTSPYSRAVTLTAGPHTIKVCADNGPLTNCSTVTNVTTQIDTTAPNAPTGGTVTFASNPSCTDQYVPTYTWNAVAADNGCAGMNTSPYHPQGSTAVGFSPLLWADAWQSGTSKAAATSYVPGTTLYFQVRSRDAFDTRSNFSSPVITGVVPSPIPYPTIHIEGPFTEKVSGLCYSNITLDKDSFAFAPTTNPNTGVTTTCKAQSNTRYECDITIDNSRGLCTVPTTTLTLNASYPGYSEAIWRTGDVCGGVAKDITATAGDLVDRSNIPLFLTYSGGSGTSGWFKLSQASFNSRENGRQNYLPNTMKTIDTSGDDSIATKYFIIGTSPGTIAQNSPVVVGPSSTAYSANNWYTTSYSHSDDMTYQKYIDYIKARKDSTAITSFPLSAASFPANGIYTVAQNVTLDPTWFDGKNVVLVVQGATASFSTNFIPVGGSVAILAKDIVIDPTVTEIDGILIGQSVSTGVSASGLKIKGNLIDESALQLDRLQADGRMPSLLVVFDVQTYMNVLSYLSTSTYDWRQIQ